MKKKETPKNNIAAKKTEGRSIPKVFWERRYFFESLIFCFSFLLFANSIQNNYNLDDELVTINHRLTSKGVSAIPEIFASPYYQDESGYSYEYRPVVLASFAIEHDIFGENPHWSHFWNVILYSLACVLLYKVLAKLFRKYSSIIAIATCLLFVAHPAHTEVVCSIKNRDEILGLLFSLLSFYFALKLIHGNLWAIIWVPTFFALALLSKLTFAPFAVIIPVAIFLFEDFDVGTYLYIVISLFVPIVIISNIGNTTTKLFILLAGVGGVIFAYCFKYFSTVKTHFMQGWSRLIKPDNFTWGKDETQIINSNDFFKEIQASFTSLTLKSIAVHFLLLGIYIYGAYFGIYSVQLIVSFILIFFFLEKKENKNWLVYLIAFVIIVFKLYYSGLYLQHYVLELFSMILAFYLLYGRRNLFISSLLAFFAVILLYTQIPDFGGGFSVPIALLVCLFLLRFRYGWFIAVTHVIIPLITDFTDSNLHFRDLIISLAFNISYLIFLFAIYFKKFQFIIAKGFLIILLLGTLVVTWQKQQDTVLIKKTITTLNSVDVKVSPKTENRPIQYIENFVDFKTPQTIKWGTSFEILFHYFTKTILPYPLSFYYGYSFIKPMKITDTIPLIGLVLHLLLLILAIFFYRKDKLICFGIVLYLLSIAIYSNYFQSVPGMIADRFMLVPSLGWIIILVVSLLRIFNVEYLLPKKEILASISKSARIAFLCVLCFYSVLSFSRNLNWRDYLTLFEHDIKYVDNSSQAHNLLAIRLMKKSFEDNILPAEQLELRKKAAQHFRKAVEIYPPFFNANYDLGRTYQLLGNADSAIFFYEKALVIDSSFLTATYAVGDLFMQQNKPKEAIPFFESCIKRFPRDFSGYERLSRALLIEKDPDQSILVLKKASEEMPKSTQPCIGLARVYHGKNMNDSTRYWLQRAIEINPADQEANGLLHSLAPQ